jgi:hypothetical protein
MSDATVSTPMKFPAKVALGAYITSLNIGLTATLIAAWPGTPAMALPAETRYLICAATAGALGSYIHLATSFIDYAGRDRLSTSWAWWYLLRPWIGSALALVVYFVLRAGFIAGPADATGAINPYGVASVCALSGMFSHQATQKLRELFENICSVRKDSRAGASE